METFHCSKCGRTSYSAHRDIVHCPHCGVERLIIINPDILSLTGELSNAKIIVDRRTADTPVDVDRRETCRGVPMAWFCYSGGKQAPAV